MKLPLKGFLLRELNKTPSAWDFELVNAADTYYGSIKSNNIYRALFELSSSRLIYSFDEKTEEDGLSKKSQVHLCYRITDFGRKRIKEIGLDIE